MIKVLSRNLIFKISAALLFTLFGMQNASATCSLLSNWKNIDVDMQGGNIVVRPTDGVGTLLATFTTPIPVANSGVPLQTGGYYQATSTCTGKALAVTLQGTLASGAGVPANVFTTNIPGIGVRMSRVVATGGGGSSTQYYTTVANNNIPINRAFGVVYSGTRFNIEVYKIASETGSGSLTPGQYSTAYFDGSGAAKPYITSRLSANVITIVTPTCEVDAGSLNQTVALNRIENTQLKGRGTTAGERGFNIRLNCVKGVGTINTIQLSFQGEHDTNTLPEDGVLKQMNTSNTAARNVGIQVRSIWNGVTQPVDIGGTMNVGPSIQGSYTIPFAARYYQTRDTQVTPGPVRAIMTFLIQYG